MRYLTILIGKSGVSGATYLTLFAIIAGPSYELERPKRDAVKYLDREIPAAHRISISGGVFADAGWEVGAPRLALLKRHRLIPVGLWLGPPQKKELLWTSRFPDGWGKLVCVRSAALSFWNADHPLVESLNKQPDTNLKSLAIQDRLVESLANEATAARFFFGEMRNGIRTFKIIQEQFPAQFLSLIELWGVDRLPIYWWTFDSVFGRDTKTYMIAADEMLELSDPFDREGNLLLPDQSKLGAPGVDFLLEEVKRLDDEDLSI